MGASRTVLLWMREHGQVGGSRFRVAILGLCIAFVTSGCVSQSLDFETAQSIQRIALAGPENPVSYELRQSDVGTALIFGAVVGPGATAGTAAPRSTGHGLSQAMASQGLKLGDELRDAIASGLGQFGYDIVLVDVARKKPSELIKSYRGLPLDVDAALDVAIQQSTYESRIWGKIGPSLTITVRLAGLPSGRQLFLRTYRYDPSAATIGYTILRPAERFLFETPEGVLARPEIAAEGFRAVIPMIVADLQSVFHREP